MSRSAFLRTLAVFAAVAIFAVSCGSDSTTDANSADASGGDAPADTPDATELLTFTAPEVGGGEFDAASVEGQDTVMWFWAPWCTVCRAEAPEVAEVAAEFDGSVRVIGVAGLGEVSDMEQFVADTGTEGFDHIVDGDGSIWSSFGVPAQPAFAFIDDSGEVEVFVGSMGKDALTEKLQALKDS